MRVLVTGAAGYLGSVLCHSLLNVGHSVVAIDDFRYGQYLALAGCVGHHMFEVQVGTVPTKESWYWNLVDKADVIIPLAALVGEPLCRNKDLEANNVNFQHVKDIARFVGNDQLIIYPNTNSAYGTGGDAPLTEDSPQNPLSTYAYTKCKAEDEILQHSNSIVFRLATVFGASPRMRTDLLVNDFVLRAVRDRYVMLFSPKARRNFVHINDVARAFCRAIAYHNDFTNRVYNLGHDGSNCTKLELCEKIKQYVPDFHWSVGESTDPDKRDYIISNQRLHTAGFHPAWTLEAGIQELIKLFQSWPKHWHGNV